MASGCARAPCVYVWVCDGLTHAWSLFVVAIPFPVLKGGGGYLGLRGAEEAHRWRDKSSRRTLRFWRQQVSALPRAPEGAAGILASPRCWASLRSYAPQWYSESMHSMETWPSVPRKTSPGLRPNARGSGRSLPGTHCHRSRKPRAMGHHEGTDGDARRPGAWAHGCGPPAALCPAGVPS